MVDSHFVLRKIAVEDSELSNIPDRIKPLSADNEHFRPGFAKQKGLVREEVLYSESMQKASELHWTSQIESGNTAWAWTYIRHKADSLTIFLSLLLDYIRWSDLPPGGLVGMTWLAPWFLVWRVGIREGLSTTVMINTIFINSSSLSVVADRNFGQPVSTFDLANTCILVVSDSSVMQNTYQFRLHRVILCTHHATVMY